MKTMLSFFIFITFQFAYSQNPSFEKRILILGDSLTEGYGIPQNQAYPALLEKLLLQKKLPVKIINAGSSGSTSASAIGRLKWHLKAKPDLMILALGANDGLRGVNLKSTEKNLAKTIELAQKEKVKVLLAGMKLPLNYGKKYRAQFEGLFKKLVQKYKIAYVPFLLQGVGGVKKLNLPDGIHPNAEGHKKIALTLLPYVEAEL